MKLIIVLLKVESFVKRFKNFLFVLLFVFSPSKSWASPGFTAHVNNIDIWYETFGDRKDPAILLIMGGLCQGILWPTEFCEALTNEGFYVIRYDHRDSGLSTCFDFTKKPYNLEDMGVDAMSLLDTLGVEKAHLCGLSMGGPIAEMMSVKFPDRVASLTLIATTIDLRPSSLSYDKDSIEGLSLPGPTDRYLEWMHEFLKNPPQSQEEALHRRVEAWSILNGDVVPFEMRRYYELHAEFLERAVHPESLTNHMGAIKNSFERILTVPYEVKVPTVVIHGTEDPILPPIHGKSLAEAIKGSKFVLVEGMGHVPNKAFYSIFIQEIKGVINQAVLKKRELAGVL